MVLTRYINANSEKRLTNFQIALSIFLCTQNWRLLKTNGLNEFLSIIPLYTGERLILNNSIIWLLGTSLGLNPPACQSGRTQGLLNFTWSFNIYSSITNFSGYRCSKMLKGRSAFEQCLQQVKLFIFNFPRTDLRTFSVFWIFFYTFKVMTILKFRIVSEKDFGFLLVKFWLFNKIVFIKNLQFWKNDNV